MSINDTELAAERFPLPADQGYEEQIIAYIGKELLSKKTVVSNKDIILELIVRLETEKDSVKLDLYRNALEYIVRATPDDL